MAVVTVPSPVAIPVRRARRRARAAGIAALWLAIVGIIGTDVFFLVERNKTTPVSLDSALRSYRAAHPVAAGGAAAAPTAAAYSAAPAAPAAVPAGGRTNATSTPATAPGRVPVAAPAPSPGPRAAPAGTAPFTRPAAGVYSYRTTGGESISVASSSHSYPSETYATVSLLDGCNWEIRNDVIKEHMDRRVICSRPGQVLQMLQEREIEFYGQRDGMVLNCQPPGVLASTGDQPGAVHESTCSDNNTSAQLRGTFVGIEPMNIGGSTVRALHVSIDGRFTGKATGTSHDELWLAPDTGMTLRWDRAVDTVADASFGAKVRYQEKASFVLESLVPRT